jgi:hypothetical protein
MNRRNRAGWRVGLLAVLAAVLLPPGPAGAEQALSTCLARHRVAVTAGESFHPLPGEQPADHTLKLRGMLGETLRNFGAAIVPVRARPTSMGDVDGLSEPMAQAEAQGATLMLALGLDARETRLVSSYLNGDQYPLRTVRLLLNAWVVAPESGDVLGQFTVNRSYAAESTDEAVGELTANDLADPLARLLRQACDSASPPPAPQPRRPPAPPVVEASVAEAPSVTGRDAAPPPPVQSIRPAVEEAPPRLPLPPAAAGQYGHRIALVIGNNAYQNIPQLHTAVTDARSIGGELEKRGFKVVFRQDATRRAMNDAIDEFIAMLSSDTVAVVYYSGHGVQINNANYLIPTDLGAVRPNQLVDDSINLGGFLDRISQTQAKFTLAIIDACRDNPFKEAGRGLGASRGLAPPIGNANGVMVVYSAGANQEALDRLSDQDRDPNGLFTRELLKAIQLPGLDVQDVIKRVRLSVIDQAKSVDHLQTPAVYDQSTGTFMFTPPQ